MACDRCLLERPDARLMPLDVFLDELIACEGCTLVEGAQAIPAVHLLVARQCEAARALRRAGSEVRKQKIELATLQRLFAEHEPRISMLEALHKKSLEETEREMLDKLAVIKAQKQALLKLAAPVLHVGDGIIAMPLIGAIDEERGAIVIESLLAEIHRASVQHVVLDLTGVEAVDERAASVLVRAAQVATLLGARVVLSGLRAPVAQAMVHLGLDLSALPTVRDLKEALRLCRAAAKPLS